MWPNTSGGRDVEFLTESVDGTPESDNAVIKCLSGRTPLNLS